MVGDRQDEEDDDGKDHIPGEKRADAVGEQLSYEEPDIEPMLGQPRQNLGERQSRSGDPERAVDSLLARTFFGYAVHHMEPTRSGRNGSSSGFPGLPRSSSASDRAITGASVTP
jgi:hypothetical protein